MNQQDRDALAAIAEQIETLSNEVRAFEHLGREETIEALKYLGKPETVAAIKGLVDIAPALTELSKGYEAAGWLGQFIKWIAGIGTAVLGLAAIWTVFFGDKP